MKTLQDFAQQILGLRRESQLARRFELRRGRFQREIAPSLQFSDARRIGIESDGAVFLAEFDRQRQPDVPKANDGNLVLAPILA